MVYTKEQIKAEIERLKKENEISEDKDYAQYELDVSCGYDMACDDILSFLSSLESENTVPSNAEEAAKEYARYHYADAFIQELAENDFLAGSVWKEVQMMKGAVECEVVDFSSSLDTNPHINVPLDNKKYRSGDKVCIIIVEEKFNEGK